MWIWVFKVRNWIGEKTRIRADSDLDTKPWFELLPVSYYFEQKVYIEYTYC